MAAPRIRIFSDLHFGDPRSTLDDLDALAPLLRDADEIILNGDTVDTVAAHTREKLPAVRAFFARPDLPRATFITGNHDPEISALAELDLLDGRVWVTHGDILFDDIAPWSHQAPEIRRRLAELSRGLSPAKLARPETRYRLNRLACRDVLESPHAFKTHALAGAFRLFHTLFPPRRLLAMLRAWRDTPRLAADLARAHRPRARVVVLGHTHRPGVWRCGGLTVVNTGSFARPLGGAFVEIAGERVRVVRIARRADGAFAAGRVLADFTATA